MKSEKLFDTKLIDSTNYRKLKGIRYSLYVLLMIIAAFLIEPQTLFKRHMSLQERMSLDFWLIIGVLLAVGAIAGIIYFYSIQFEEKGRLRIFTNGIEISKQQISDLSVDYQEMEGLKIERGATYHYEYQRDNYLHKANNWVSFEHKGKRHKHEFIIDSAVKNKEFEDMVTVLRRNRIQCEYLSI